MLQKGIHNFGDLCKYGHVRQANGGTGACPGTHPTLETNKQLNKSPPPIFVFIPHMFFSATNKSGCKTTSTSSSSRRDSDWTSVSTEDPGYGSMRSDNQVNGSRRCSELSSASQVGLCFFFQSLGFFLQKVTRVQIGYSPK